MIKVLFVNPFADLSGPEQVVLRLMGGLDATRFASALVCPADGRLADAAKVAGLSVHYAPLRNTTFSRDLARQAAQTVALARQLSATVRAGGFDVVHVNSHRIGLPCSLAARFGGAASLWHIHEIYQTSAVRRSVIVGLARLAPDALVAVSGAVANQFRPCRKVTRIYNGIEPDAFAAGANRERARRELGYGADDMVVGCMGRLSRQKGQDVFLRAAALLSRWHPSARFVVVGDEALGERGFRGELERLSLELGLADKVVFAGFRSDAASVVAAMDIFVHPTVIPDSLPNVILEAMALGRPVVATATGGSPELVAEAETGLLVPPAEPLSLAKGIAELVASANLRCRFGAAGRQRVRERFGWRQHVGQFEALYQRLAASRKGGARAS